MPNVVDIAEAVVTALNAGSFSQVFTAARAYEPEYDVGADEGLRVFVVPGNVEGGDGRRSRVRERSTQVQVGVIKRVGAREDATRMAACDDLVTLEYEIMAAFDLQRISGLDAACIDTAIEPPFDPERLRQKGVFLGVVVLTFLVQE